MKLIALDPSSSRTGYAVFDAHGFPTEVGALAPTRKKDEPNARIVAMIVSLREIVAEHKPDVIVIEDTSGKVGAGARARGVNGAGLAIHGKAVGWFISEARHLLGAAAVVTVLENEWAASTPKAIRANRTRYEFPHLEPCQDADALDAVGVGHWWLTIGRHRTPIPGKVVC